MWTAQKRDGKAYAEPLQIRYLLVWYWFLQDAQQDIFPRTPSRAQQEAAAAQWRGGEEAAPFRVPGQRLC